MKRLVMLAVLAAIPAQADQIPADQVNLVLLHSALVREEQAVEAVAQLQSQLDVAHKKIADLEAAAKKCVQAP